MSDIWGQSYNTSQPVLYTNCCICSISDTVTGLNISISLVLFITLISVHCKNLVLPSWHIAIFYWRNLSARTMALGPTQPLTEVSTKNISWGEGGRLRRPLLKANNLTISSGTDWLEIRNPQPPGIPKACPAITLPLIGILHITKFMNSLINKQFRSV